MNILVRADSSSEIGLGHIMRDLVLCEQYPNDTIYFASINYEGNISDKVLSAGHQLIVLEGNSEEEIISVIQKNKIRFMIIDHYNIDYIYEKNVKERTNIKILSVDDTYEKHHCDILLNHSVGADETRYRNLVPPNCQIKCGKKHNLIRKEFKDITLKTRNKPIKNILLAIGGSDSSNLNIDILKVLIQFNQFHVNVLTTSSNKHLESLKAYIKPYPNIHCNVDSKNVASDMNNNDFAIITPSVIVHEVMQLDIPFLVIKTAENQNNLYRYLREKEYLSIKRFNPKRLYSTLEAYQRIHLIPFINLSLEKKKMILAWRNSDSIREWMHNSSEITLETHLKFIESLDEKNQHYLILYGNKSIGAVNFNNIKNRQAELGFYQNPELHGHGSMLLKTIIDYGFNMLNLYKLSLEVLIHNQKAIHLYKKFGFTTTGRTKKIYAMELLNERH